MERTFVMVKNDGVMRRLIGRIISRFEEKGLYLVNIKVLVPTIDVLRKHYAEHVNKPFFQGMANAMIKTQVVPMIWEGENAVEVARKLIGSTNPMAAECGSIRGDFGSCIGKNIVHGSDSVESAKREISIWFGDDDTQITHFDKDIIME